MAEELEYRYYTCKDVWLRRPHPCVGVNDAYGVSLVSQCVKSCYFKFNGFCIGMGYILATVFRTLSHVYISVYRAYFYELG